MPYAEDICEQIDKSNICCNELYSKFKIKNSLRGLAFNMINFEDAYIFKDSKKIRILQQIFQNVAILKPHKGNCVVLFGKQDHNKLLEQLFKDQEKKILHKDPIITRMTTLVNYLKNLCSKKEFSKAEFNQMRPKNSKPARVHGLTRKHKTFTNIPNFRPIIDTSGSSYYLVGRYIAQLLYPLTNNELNLKDLFEAAYHIQDITSNVFGNGYKNVLFK